MEIEHEVMRIVTAVRGAGDEDDRHGNGALIEAVDVALRRIYESGVSAGRAREQMYGYQRERLDEHSDRRIEAALEQAG